MLSISQLQPGTTFLYNGKPQIVLESKHLKMGRGGGIQQIKMRSLRDNSILSNNFKGNEKLEEAEIERKKVQFLYADADKAHFMDNQIYDQFEVNRSNLGRTIEFTPEGTIVDLLFYENELLSVDPPIKLKVKVKSAPPGLRGGRESAGTKLIEIETGAIIQAPLFIQDNDEIIIDTRSGKYVERAK